MYNPLEINEERDFSSIFTGVMNRVYLYMFGGLLLTAIISWLLLASENLLVTIISNPMIFFGLLIAELVLVIVFSARIHKMSSGAAMTCFISYSILNGITLSPIFLIYTQTSIASVFFITCAVFGVMSLYGYFTKKDLTGIGSLCFMGLIGIIIAGVVNLFFTSDMMSFMITGIGIVVFLGLTAYDTQKIKGYLMEADCDDMEHIKKVSTRGALILYLDFINLFLKLLRLLGKRR